MVLVWFVSLPPPQREKVLKAMHWVKEVGAGPIENWPFDFGWPLHQALAAIEANRVSAAWVGRLAVQLEVVAERLPK
jgi:hypothetical protein